MQNPSQGVIDGRVVVGAELLGREEVAMDGDDTFEVDAELEAVLLESIAQGRRGEMEDATSEVTKAGGKVLGEPMEIPGVGLYVSFMDTEDNRVSMLKPADRMVVRPQSE